MAEITQLYGLVGRNIEYSFSRQYFANKFEDPQFQHCAYQNFDIADIALLPQIIEGNPTLRGFNVTIPYKQSVIQYLDQLSETAAEIGAVNTVKISKTGSLMGHNTDWSGFHQSIVPMLAPHHQKALILGTGGASKAIAYALTILHIDFAFVSRTPEVGQFTYNDLTRDIMDDYAIIINCTPLGTSPNVGDSPPIPYEYISSKHLVFDLIYNPEVTLFLQKALKAGAKIKNGYEMLVNQAEQAWQIWQIDQ